MRMCAGDIWTWPADRDMAGVRVCLLFYWYGHHFSRLLVYEEKIKVINLSGGEYI